MKIADKFGLDTIYGLFLETRRGRHFEEGTCIKKGEAREGHWGGERQENGAKVEQEEG